MSLQQKKQAIIAELKEIAKTGYNTNQNYAYLKEGDILSVLKPLLIKYGIVITPSLDWDHASALTKDGDLTTVFTKYVITDLETNETEICYWAGQGADRGDKGANKAFTAAGKYFMIKYFMIESDEDADADSTLASPASAQTARPTAPTRPAAPRPALQPTETGASSAPKTSTTVSGGQNCELCNKYCGPGVVAFSKKNFNGKVLCMECQKKQE